MPETPTRKHHWTRLRWTWLKAHKALARALVTRYTKSDLLREARDVEKLRWPMQGLIERLVKRKEAIELHEKLDAIAPLLSAMDWCVLRLLLTVLDQFIYVQRKLEFNKVTGSLAVPLI